MVKITFKGKDYEVVETNTGLGDSCSQCALKNDPCYDDGAVVCKCFDIIHPNAFHHLVRL